MRIILVLMGFVGVMFLPPWVPLLCIIGLSLRFRSWEAVLIGLTADLVWLPHSAHLLPFFTVLSLIIAWGLEPLRLQFLR